MWLTHLDDHSKQTNLSSLVIQMAISRTSSSASWAMLILVVVLISATAKGDNSISPSLSPFIQNLCDEVNCGKGNCSAQIGKPFNFVCECEPGWKRTRLDNENDLEFLPCVIPNCSLDYSCMPAPPPAPAVPYNLSFFDPCYWIYCGEGTCTKSNTYTHTCQCNSGQTNLLNILQFPCYNECALGSDCATLGIRVSNSTSSSPGGSSSQGETGSGTSQGTSFLPGKFHWVAIVLVSVALALRN